LYQKTNTFIYKSKIKNLAKKNMLKLNVSNSQNAKELLAKMSTGEKLAQMVSAWHRAEELLSQEGELVHEKASEIFPHGLGQIGRIFHGMSAAESAKLYNSLQQYFVENTRLGIPVLAHDECLHGLMEYDAVSFPHPIAMACSFRPDLVEKAYAHSAKDASARGIRQALSPVLDVARDPRWGRVEETFGEDPWLVAEMGLAAIRGLQGDAGEKLQAGKVIATLKHFAAHGQPEDGTNCAPANYSERIIREIFLYPFKKAIAAGAMSVMASYNEIDGQPSHSSKWLLKDVLKNEWGFNGTVVSDYYGIEQLYERHCVAASDSHAAELALKAGIDIELPENRTYQHLEDALQSGRINIGQIDDAVTRLLEHKYAAGLFDNPYVCPQKADETARCPEAQNLALEFAKECAVLLKNNGILPINKDTCKTISVIGPNAAYNSIGGYACPNKHFVTMLEGIKHIAGPQAEVLYSLGCQITKEGGSWFKDEVELADSQHNLALIEEAANIAMKSDIIILCLGGNEQTNREAWKETHLGDSPCLDLAGQQEALFERLLLTGVPIVAVLSHGGPIAINSLSQKADAILDCWYLGEKTGTAAAELLWGKANPSGKLSISVPRSAGHIPVFYNHKPNARRGYIFGNIAPLFPFGFGLSYTTFCIEDARLEHSKEAIGRACRILFKLRNTGGCAGSETVQAYIRDKVSSLTRPVKELKGFCKMYLEPGQEKEGSIIIEPEEFMFYNDKMELVTETGEFGIYIGTSSDNKDLQELSFFLE
jgi:beta-glucosidase